jgi:hypothetical protein
VPQAAVSGPLAVFNLANKVRLDPVRVAGMLAGYHLIERAGGTRVAAQHGQQISKNAVGEAGADVPDVAQSSSFVVHAQ